MKKKPIQPAPGESVYPELFRAPPTGSIIVRFLSEARASVLFHEIRKQQQPCPGVDKCPASEHRLKSTWKAYAEALVWRDGQYQDWVPGAFELTERLFEEIGTMELTGTMWEMSRVPGRFGYIEVVGRQVAADNLSAGDVARLKTFRLEAVLSRTFRAGHIDFAAPAPFAPRVQVAPLKIAPPPKPAVQPPPAELPRVPGQVKQMIAEERAKRLQNPPS